MKKFILSLFTALAMFTSCEQIDLPESNTNVQNIEQSDSTTIAANDTTKLKTLVLNAKFKTSQEQMVTRAIATGSTVYMKAYDVMDGNIVDTVNCGQITFPTFPSVTFKSKYGQHKFVFIISAKAITDNNNPITFEKSSDVLLGELDLNVYSRTAKTHNVNLNRITSQIKFILEDDADIASNLNKVVVTYKNDSNMLNILGDSIKLETSGDLVTSVTADFASYLKQGSTPISSYLLVLGDEEHTVDVNIQFLDAQGNILASYDLNGVPYKRNYITTISGQFLGSTSDYTFNYDIDWKEDTSLNFGLNDYLQLN